MRSLWLVLMVLGIATVAVSATSTRLAVAFDMSPPLSSMEQFIPGKQVEIHRAVESRAERQGALKGPGTGLGATAPGGGGAARGGRAGRAGTPPPIPPPAPQIGAAGAAVEQTTQGKRAAIAPIDSFDGLGEGFAGGRGGIDISLAVGPDHLFEILNGNMAVFSKKGKKYPATGKLLYGAVPNNTVFGGFGVRCGVSNNSDSVVRYDQLADRWLIVVPVFTSAAGQSARSLRHVLRGERDPGSSGTVLPLRVPTAAVSRLSPSGDLARRLLQPHQHKRQPVAGGDHAETRLHRRPQQDAQRSAGYRAVRGDRRRCFHVERRCGRQAAAAARARPTS